MKITPTIPLTQDVAALIGQNAQKVDNRSLLFEKFVFHKKWPMSDSYDAKPWDEASRWSLMRIAHQGDQLLNEESKNFKSKSQGKSVSEENQTRFRQEAEITQSLAKLSWNHQEIQKLQKMHAERIFIQYHSIASHRRTMFLGRSAGRLAINLAEGLIENSGICIDRFFGMPFIPGSALKGVARHAAIHEIRNIQDQTQKEAQVALFCQVFGTSESDHSSLTEIFQLKPPVPKDEFDQKGSVCFLPAYPVNEAKIVVDLTNVHYPKYYQKPSGQDFTEKPILNYFPAVEVGAEFAFQLIAPGTNPDPNLLSTAQHWLQVALTQHGIGAKTSSGYGWFSLMSEEALVEHQERAMKKQFEKRQQKAELREQERKQLEDRQRLESLTPFDRAKEEILSLDEEALALFAKSLPEKTEPQQLAFLDCLQHNKDIKERYKKWKKKNKTPILKSIEDVCQQLGHKLNS